MVLELLRAMLDPQPICCKIHHIAMDMNTLLKEELNPDNWFRWSLYMYRKILRVVKTAGPNFSVGRIGKVTVIMAVTSFDLKPILTRGFRSHPCVTRVR